MRPESKAASAAAGPAGIGGYVFVLEATPFIGRVDNSVRVKVALISVLIGYLSNYSG